MTELKGYSPLGAEAQVHINEAWKDYRKEFGLEAEIAYGFDASMSVEVRCKKIEENLPVWKELWITK